MNRALLFVVVLSLSGCAGTIVSDNVAGNTPSVDSTTPKQYPPGNSGFVGYVTINGVVFGILTEGKRVEYNNLVHDYAVRFRDEWKHDVVKDGGLLAYIDSYGNTNLWTIDLGHLKDLGRLEVYKHNHLSSDTLFDKL